MNEQEKKEILIKYVVEKGEEIYKIEESEFMKDMEEMGVDGVIVDNAVTIYESYTYNAKSKKVLHEILDKLKLYETITFFDSEEEVKAKTDNNTNIEIEIIKVFVDNDLSKTDVRIMESFIRETIVSVMAKLKASIEYSYTEIFNQIVTGNTKKAPTVKEIDVKLKELQKKKK